MQKGVGVKAFRFIIKDIIIDAFTWPFWWYTTGTVDAVYRMGDMFRQANDELALSVWIKNIFVPMYGDFTIQGRLISFFMRVVQIILRSFLYLGWAFFAIVVFVLWLLLPAFVVWQIIYNIFF